MEETDRDSYNVSFTVDVKTALNSNFELAYGVCEESLKQLVIQNIEEQTQLKLGNSYDLKNILMEGLQEAA